MITFLIYILKSSFCLLFLYLLYKLLLSSVKQFSFNRYTILLGISVCMILPFVSIEIGKDISAPLSFYELEEVFMSGQNIDSVSSENNVTENHELIATEVIIVFFVIMYMTGAALVFLSWIISYVRMMNIIRRIDTVEHDGMKWKLTDSSIRPLSFWKYIVVSDDDYHNASPVCIHEKIHVRHRHYYDDLLLQLVLVFHWFNPAVWLLRNELKTVHEYQADDGVLKSGIDATKYQLLLVEKAVGSRLYSMARGFSHNSLKKRISMMLKKKDSKWTRLRVLPAVPIVAGIMYVFATPEVKDLNNYGETCVQDSVQVDYSDNLLSEIKSDGDYVVVYLYVNKRNQYLLNRDIVLKEIDENTTVKIKDILVGKFIEEYNRKKENPLPVVMCIKADRDSRMEAVNEIKRNVRNAYSQANAELKMDYPSDVVDKCMQPKLFYTYPKVTTDNPSGISSDETVLNGFEIRFIINDEGEIMKLKDFPIRDLKDAISSISESYDIKELTVSLKFPPDASEGMVYDLKQVLRNAYFLKLNQIH